MYVMAPQAQPLSQSEQSSSTCWFITALISAICCCLPLGVAGAIAASASREEAMRGNAIGHRQKLKQAKVFTVLSYLVGAGLIIGLIMWALSFFYNPGSIYIDEDPNNVGKWSDKGVYIGCYNNHSPDPDLNSSSVYWTDNNVDKCVRYCAEKRTKYAGLSNGYCYCGNSYGRYGKADADDFVLIRACPS
ncbi:KREMEN1 [Bugula neritina]|uniref:KREMEN1 n=1 Tax=Bugula neritina TaxID=10212 RepID=A0A7J7JVQ3_BUGNE|nr:KREMEN1 [Bugula neritina]